MQRIVVKIGSQVLCDDGGRLNTVVLTALVGQLAALHREGWQVLVVSSGAVAAGQDVPLTGRLDKGDPVTRKQVLAAADQVRLMQSYHQLFDGHGLAIAQVLASKSDFQTRNHYLNMRNCIEGILDNGMIPVVNENDVVSITELMFTDNDELAGLLASMVNADLMCMLSTVTGVFAGDHVIEQWDESLHKVDEIVGDGTSWLGRGGMHSKISVARKTAALGTPVVIADGRVENILHRIATGETCGTRFAARTGVSPAKRWLASANDHAAGTVRINAGAEQALRDKNQLTSLLLVGAVALDGDFSRGDVIRIVGENGSVIGVGRARYDCKEARELLGQKDLKPLIHCDYLYLTE